MAGLVAAALAAGIPVPVAAVLVLASAWPLLGVAAAVGLAGAWLRRRSRAEDSPVDEAALCSAIAVELWSGSSLRHALAAAAGPSPPPLLASPVRAALAGAPAPLVSAGLARALPANGRHVSLAFELASETGAGAAAVFSRLASRAASAADIARERRVLTTQARLSAAVVGGAPLAIVIVLTATGRLGLLTGGGVGTAVGVIGLALIGAGLFAVWVLLRGMAHR